MGKAERDMIVAKILLQFGKPRLYKLDGQWWASTKGTCGGGYTAAHAYNMWLNMVARKHKWQAIRQDDRFLHRPFTNESEGTRIVKLLPMEL